MIIPYIEEKTERLIREVGISKAPIDVIRCAKFLNVDVQSSMFDDEISGLFVMKDKMAFIRFNSNQGEERIRFTIAHELGHYVLHNNIPLIIDKGKNENIMFRDSSSSTGELRREREANSFAASLLMPKFLIETEIKKLFKKTDLIESLAVKFNVSQDAMKFRLINLGLIEYGIFS